MRKKKKLYIIVGLLCLCLGFGTMQASCKAEGMSYSKNGAKITVRTPEGTVKYHDYTQGAYGLKSFGCVVTTVATIASGFGERYTPRQINSGSSSQKYSARHAVKKMGMSSALNGRAAISVVTAAQIFKDMGIKAKAVCRFNKKQAVREITEHVSQGKPVLVKANAVKWKGIRIANAHHSLALIGIDEDGNGIFVDPMTGSVNYAHSSRKHFKVTIKQFVEHFMTPAKGKYKVPYVTSTAAAGGYILVG